MTRILQPDSGIKLHEQTNQGKQKTCKNNLHNETLRTGWRQDPKRK